MIYSNTLRSSFQFDDLFVIVENPAIRSLNNWPALFDAFNTRFIAGLTFALNYHFGGLDVFGYHLFNICVHIAASIVVFYMVQAILLTPRLKNQIADRSGWIALFASLFFLVHPVQTQAVTYIWQRTASLATLFYLAAVYTYVRARLQKSWILIGASLVLTLLAMLTKEIAFTLPFLLCLVEILFYNRREQKKLC